MTTDEDYAVYPFLARNDSSHRTDYVMVRARQIPIGEREGLMQALGLRELLVDIPVKEFGLQKYKCGGRVESIGQSELKLHLGPGAQEGMALVIKRPRNLDHHDGALFVVEQFADKQVVGGVAVLMRGKQPAKSEKSKRRE